jgi:hypothetical protein
LPYLYFRSEDEGKAESAGYGKEKAEEEADVKAEKKV